MRIPVKTVRQPSTRYSVNVLVRSVGLSRMVAAGTSSFLFLTTVHFLRRSVMTKSSDVTMRDYKILAPDVIPPADYTTIQSYTFLLLLCYYVTILCHTVTS